MSVDQLQREQELTRLPVVWPLDTPVWRPRLMPLLVSLTFSLLLWAVIVVFVRWVFLSL
jgi:hypothetical protein